MSQKLLFNIEPSHIEKMLGMFKEPVTIDNKPQCGYGKLRFDVNVPPPKFN